MGRGEGKAQDQRTGAEVSDPEKAGAWGRRSPGEGSVGVGEGREEVEFLACECGGACVRLVSL